MIGNGNVIVLAGQVIQKPVVVVKPGAEHISQEEACEIKGLVDEVVRLERGRRAEPCGYQAVWSRLNAAMGVTRYLMIPRRRYSEARAFLLDWIGRLQLEPADPLASPVEQARRTCMSEITRIVAERGWDQQWGAWMAEYFGTSSLDALNSDQLWLAHRQLVESVAAGCPDRPG